MDIQTNPVHAILFLLAIVGFLTICSKLGRKKS